MSVDDQKRWDERYQSASAAVEVSAPAGLERFGALLPESGTAIDVACGAGGSSVWLASRGLEVVGVDISPVAVATARDLASAAGLDHRCRFDVVDLDNGLPAGDPVDLVVCHRFNAPALDDALLERLGPNGILAVTVLSEVGSSPGPFRASEGNLLARFGHHQVLAHLEEAGEATIIVRFAGPKPLGRLD